METYHEDDKDEENTSAPSERPVPRMPEGILFFDRHHDDMVRGNHQAKEKDKDSKKDKSKSDKSAPKPEQTTPAARELGKHVPLPWPEIVPRPTELTETKTAESSDDDQDQVTDAAHAPQPAEASRMAEDDGVFAVYQNEAQNYTDPSPIDPAKEHARSMAAFGVKPKQHAAQPAPEFIRVNPGGTPEGMLATASPDGPAHTGETASSYDPMNDPELQDIIGRIKAANESKANAPTEPTEWERRYDAAVNANNDPYRQYGYGGGEWSPAANMTTPSMPIERPKHEPIYDNRPRGVAAVAALLGLEHIGRKRADKALTELIKENASQQQEQMATQQRMAEKQRQASNEQQQQGRQIEQLRSGQAASAHMGEQFTSAPSAELGGARPVYRQHEMAPAGVAMPAIHERVVPGANAEARRPVDATPAEQPTDAEAMNLQPKQRVEHSSWHNIVVERGHAVQDAINYGEGFQRERQQEVLRDSVADATAATTYSASTGVQPSYPAPHFGGLPSGMTTPGLPQGTPTHVDPQHQLPATTKKSMGGLWFWLMLAIVIAAFFTAAFI